MSAPAAAANPPPSENPLRKVRLVKVVVHTGVGESGEPRTKAEKVLQMLTHQKPVATRARSTNRDFAIRAGQEIGAKVTLRGAAAEEFLGRAFESRDKQFDPASIDRVGNFSFGVADYTDFTGMKYDPEIGIVGLDICVEMGRAGWRVRDRRRGARAIAPHLRATPEETRVFVVARFGLTLLE